MPWTKYGGKNWFVGCLVSEPRLAVLQSGKMRRLTGALENHRALGGVGRECGLCPDFASNTVAFALELRKITEQVCHGNRRALG